MGANYIKTTTALNPMSNVLDDEQGKESWEWHSEEKVMKMMAEQGVKPPQATEDLEAE